MNPSANGFWVQLEGNKKACFAYGPSKPPAEADDECKCRLFCFPDWTSTHMIFQRWTTLLPSWIQVYVVELPGRGKRFDEESDLSLVDLARLLVQELKDRELVDHFISFFGHGMLGSILSYECCKLLKDSLIMFTCDSKPPHLLNDLDNLHSLSPCRLKDVLSTHYPSTFPSFLLKFENSFNSFMYQSIIKDRKLLETYKYNGKLLELPIVVFYSEANMNYEFKDLFEWADETSENFNAFEFEQSDYFYKNEIQMIEIICLEIHEKVEFFFKLKQPKKKQDDDDKKEVTSRSEERNYNRFEQQLLYAQRHQHEIHEHKKQQIGSSLLPTY